MADAVSLERALPNRLFESTELQGLAKIRFVVPAEEVQKLTARA
jgi:hypothetical protein